MRKLLLIVALVLAAGLGLNACKKAPTAPATPVPGAVFHGHGVVQLFQAEGRIVVLKHEKIEGLMDAMTMGFELKDPAQSKSLKVGDTADFTLEMNGEAPWITDIKKAGK